MSVPAEVYVVLSARGVEQVFTAHEDATAFTREHPDTWISHHPVRGSMDDAVVVFDRKVVVTRGATVLDRTDLVRQFVDDPEDLPAQADVEYFLDRAQSEWHIAGFGIDKDAVDAQVQRVIDELAAMNGPGTLAAVAGRGRS